MVTTGRYLSGVVSLVVTIFVTGPAWAIDIIGVLPNNIEAGVTGDQVVGVHIMGAAAAGGLKSIWVGDQIVSQYAPCIMTNGEQVTVAEGLLQEPGWVSVVVEGCDGSVSAVWELQVTGIGASLQVAMLFGLGVMLAFAFIKGMGQW